MEHRLKNTKQLLNGSVELVTDCDHFIVEIVKEQLDEVSHVDGALSFNALHVSKKTFKSMLYLISSQ